MGSAKKLAERAHQEPDLNLNDTALHYLDTIYRLSERHGSASTTEIAAQLGVTPSGASIMLKRLAERGLVQLTPYRGAVLTEHGRRIALRTIRRHRLLEAFLYHVMGFAWHEVDEHAHALETVINERFEDRMDEMLGHPLRCPHGHLIPSKTGEMPVVNDVPLLSLPLHTRSVVRCIDTSRDDWLEYLGAQGLMPGCQLQVVEVAPYNGPVTLRTDAGETISLGRNMAELILVEPL